MGTIFGGAGLKVIEHQLGKAKTRAAESATAREELRKEIESLRQQLIRADGEEARLQGLVDEWREKYWSYREETQRELSKLSVELERLKNGGRVKAE